MHVAMVLTDKKIRELVKKEELIVPFNESNLQSESYDVTIGTEITELSKEIHCIDISKQETVDNIYINIGKWIYYFSEAIFTCIFKGNFKSAG